MATGQLVLDLDPDVIRDLERLASRDHRDARTFVKDVVESLVRQPWRTTPIDPAIGALIGVIPDRGRPYRQTVEDAIADRHDDGSRR